MSERPFDLLELKRIIVESLNLQPASPESIGDHERLFGGRLDLDSIDALELIIALEKHLGVKIPADQIDDSALQSPAALYRFVKDLVEARRSVK